MSKNLKNKIIDLLDRIEGLPELDRKNVIEFAQHNEWGIALDALCNQIYEHNLTISQEVYDEITKIGFAMRMDESEWSFLRELIG